MRCRKPAFLGKIDQKANRLISDSVLRVVEVDAGSLHRHPVAPVGIIGKKRSQMRFADPSSWCLLSALHAGLFGRRGCLPCRVRCLHPVVHIQAAFPGHRTLT